MKKWLRRLIVGAGILVVGLVFLVLTASLVVRQIAVHRAERDFPPPGRLVEIDGRLSHIHCTGVGSPTILLESGLDDRGSWSWADIRNELSQISRVCAYDRTGSLGNRPVVVLTASEALTMPGVSDEGNAAMRRIWLELHKELAGLSTNSDHRIVEGAGHYIHRDRPKAVVAAIRDVVTAVQGGGPVRSEAADAQR